MGDEIFAHYSKVDLGKPEARSRFADDVRKGRPGIDGAAIEKELLRIRAELSSRNAKRDERSDEKPNERDSHELLMRMPEHVRAERGPCWNRPS